MVRKTGLGGSGGSTLTEGASKTGCTGITGKGSGIFSAGFFFTTAALSGGASALAWAAGGVTGAATGTGAGSSVGAAEATACGAGEGATSATGAAAGVGTSAAASVALSLVANQ